MKSKKFLRSLLAVLTLTLFLVAAPVPVGSNSNQALASNRCGGVLVLCTDPGNDNDKQVIEQNKQKIDELSNKLEQVKKQNFTSLILSSGLSLVVAFTFIRRFFKKQKTNE